MIDQDDEQEILHEELIQAVMVTFTMVPALESVEPAVLNRAASLAAIGVIRRLRVLSGRQVAVLLADEPNRHEVRVIHEPPKYATAGE